MAWLIALVASIIADIQNPYPKYAWWTIAYMFCCIIGITITFAANAANHYAIAVCRSHAQAAFADLLPDCRIPRRWPGDDHICSQHPDLPECRHHASCCGWFYPPFDDLGKPTSTSFFGTRLTYQDHLDLLLWICTTNHSSTVRRRLCPPRES